MKILGAILLSASLAAAADEGVTAVAAPDAATLMESVVAQLPTEPLTISGEIEVTRRHGTVTKKLLFEMQLDFAAKPPTARYTLRDSLGKDLSRLTLIRRDATVDIAYESGDPLKAAEKPAMNAPVEGTDMTWQDLTLSFLWWRDGNVVGEDVVKGRACHVVELKAPEGQSGKVKLWIDKQVPMMLQAEAYDAKGAKTRSLWIKSFKKIKGQWMVREMEIQQEPPAHRTHVTITSLDGQEIADATAEAN